MEKILFKLNAFCCANKIEYIVTGTLALHLLGVPSNFIPHDIDIKVFHLTEEQSSKLTELQFLSGIEIEETYEKNCYSFYIDGVKINAIVCDNRNYDEILGTTVCLNLRDEQQAKYHRINVQKVIFAIEDKMKLNRPKDIKYMLNLIANLSNMSQNYEIL